GERGGWGGGGAGGGGRGGGGGGRGGGGSEAQARGGALRRHAIEEGNHTGLERVLRTDHEQPVVLDELLEQLRAVAQVIGRHADVGAHGLLLQSLPVARWRSVLEQALDGRADAVDDGAQVA